VPPPTITMLAMAVSTPRPLRSVCDRPAAWRRKKPARGRDDLIVLSVVTPALRWGLASSDAGE